MEEKIEREFFVSITFYCEDEHNGKRITGIRGDISFIWDETEIFYLNLKKAVNKVFKNFVDLDKFYFHVDALCEITKNNKKNDN